MATKNTAMKPLSLTDEKMKLPLQQSWGYVEKLGNRRYGKNPNSNGINKLDVLRILVFNSVRRLPGFDGVGPHTAEHCDSIIFGVQGKIRNRRFKKAIIWLLVGLSITSASILFTIISLFHGSLVAIAPTVLLLMGFWGIALIGSKDGTNPIQDYLSWNKSCSLNGLRNMRDEDPIFLDLPYMILLIEETSAKLAEISLDKFARFGTEGFEQDIKAVWQGIFNEMIELAKQIDLCSQDSAGLFQKAKLPGLRCTLYNLISISVHLNLFGAKPEDTLAAKEDWIQGLYTRAFTAMEQMKHEGARSSLTEA